MKNDFGIGGRLARREGHGRSKTGFRTVGGARVGVVSFHDVDVDFRAAGAGGSSADGGGINTQRVVFIFLEFYDWLPTPIGFDVSRLSQHHHQQRQDHRLPLLRIVQHEAPLTCEGKEVSL